MALGLNQVMTGLAADSDHSASIDPGRHNNGSLQVKWAGLTGTLSATYSLMCSLNGIDYKPKNDSSNAAIVVTVSGAGGNDIVSLNGVLSEPFYRLDYAHLGVTSGTVDAWFYSRPSEGA